MEITNEQNYGNFLYSAIIFAKNMIRKLPACPFVSQMGVSTAIGNGL